MPATTTTSKTTTTVKQTNLTAAAKDDSFLAQSTGATEDNSVRLSVLANDPGAAKLYSVWQVPEGTSSSTQVQVMTTSTLKSGAVIAINADGTISYDPRNAFQSLAEGELATDTFTYTVRMANGTLSTANVSVQVLGKNDVATISGISTGAVTEDAGGTASGKLAVASGQHLVWTVPTAHSASIKAPGHSQQTTRAMLCRHLPLARLPRKA
jgi:VCBS repeat-containing protein